MSDEELRPFQIDLAAPDADEQLRKFADACRGIGWGEDALPECVEQAKVELTWLIPAAKRTAGLFDGLELLGMSQPAIRGLLHDDPNIAALTVAAACAEARPTRVFQAGQKVGYGDGWANGYFAGWDAAREQIDRLIRLLGADATKLEPHHRRILIMVANGMDYGQIGTELRRPKPLSKRTVKYHFQTAAGVLGISTTELRRKLRRGTV